MEPTKRQWTAPAAKPITEAGSRADERDVPPANGVPGPSELAPN